MVTVQTVPFRLGNELFASIEGFAKAIRFPESSPERECFAGFTATEIRELLANEPERGPVGDRVFWQSHELEINGRDHRQLMRQAVTAAKRAAGIAPKIKVRIVSRENRQTRRLAMERMVEFVLDGETFHSLTGFSMAIVLPEDSLVRRAVSRLSGPSAFDFAAELPRDEAQIRWQGAGFAIDSDEARELLANAVRARIMVDDAASRQLLDSGGDSLDPPRGRAGRRRVGAFSVADYVTVLEIVRDELIAGHSIVPIERILNVGSRNPRTCWLSNFAETPFEMDGVKFASMEAFVHCIKFAPEDPRREGISKLTGGKAKRAATEINNEVRTRLESGEPARVYWDGECHEFRSAGHTDLIGRALRNKFEQSAIAREQLAATGDAILIHRVAKRESSYTSLPAETFCRLLTQLRKDLRRA